LKLYCKRYKRKRETEKKKRKKKKKEDKRIWTGAAQSGPTAWPTWSFPEWLPRAFFLSL
jgi:hypothetical protein